MVEGGHVFLIVLIRVEGHTVLVEDLMGVKPAGQPQQLAQLQQGEASLSILLHSEILQHAARKVVMLVLRGNVIGKVDRDWCHTVLTSKGLFSLPYRPSTGMEPLGSAARVRKGECCMYSCQYSGLLLDNRAENSPQPTQQRERRMQGFRSPGHAQRFLAVYGPIAQHFRPRRHQFSAPEYRLEMRKRIDTWRDITSLSTAA